MRIHALSGALLLSVPDNASAERVAAAVELELGINRTRFALVENGANGVVVVLHSGLPVRDPIAMSFALDFPGNPIVGVWRSTTDVWVVCREPQLAGRLLVLRLACDARPLLLGLPVPLSFDVGRLWWRATMYARPDWNPSLLEANWWNDPINVTGSVTFARGQKHELLLGASAVKAPALGVGPT